MKKENKNKIIYYKELEKVIDLKANRYDSLIFERVNKEILKNYFRNDLEYYLKQNGYKNFKLEKVL